MDEDLRAIALKRIKAKRSFWSMVGIFAALIVVMNVIWLFSGYSSYYWPAWPMLGLGIATIFSALSTFGSGSKPITEAQIDQEIRKMNGEK